MAIVIRGKYKNKKVMIQQWCNDWFSVDVDGLPVILSPTQLKLTPHEAENVALRPTGFMFARFLLAPTSDKCFIFKKRKLK